MRRLFFCIALMAGCNGGAVLGGNDALVGTWTASFVGKTLSYSFSSDGTLSFIVDTTMASGTWSANTEQIVVDASEAGGKNRGRVTESFVIVGNTMAMPDYSAVGTPVGIVGTWKATQKIEMFGTDGKVSKTANNENTYELAADGTAKWTVVADGATQYSASGTWTANGANGCSLVLGAVTLSCELVGGKMALPPLQRLMR